MKKTIFVMIAGLFLIAGSSYAFIGYNPGNGDAGTELTVPDKDPKTGHSKNSEKDKDKKSCADNKTSNKTAKACSSSCSTEKKTEDCCKTKSSSPAKEGVQENKTSTSNCPKTKCR